MSGLDIGIIIGYLIVVISVGVISSRRAKTSDDYMVAGRRLGYGVSFACLCAILLGGASTVGTTSLGYTYGISGIWLVSMLGLGLLIVAVFLIRKIYNMKIVTMSQLLANRFGSKAGILSALVSAVYTMMVCATQIIAMGTVLRSFLGWDAGVSMLVIGGIVVVYTILGGMWAITLTDFIQFILIIFGIVFIMMPTSLSTIGGFGALTETLPAEYFNLTSIGWPTIIQYFFLYCLGTMVGQDIWQRFLTAKSVKVAKRSGIAAGIFALVYAISCAVIGMCAQVYMPGMEDTQLVFATFAGEILGTGLLGIVMAAVLAVLMSTASGTLLASSSLLTNDVIKPLWESRKKKSAVEKTEEELVTEKAALDKRTLSTSRLVAAGVGVFAIIAAMVLNDIIAALDVSYAILSGALFFPIILGIFWKKATPQAAIVSIVGSSVVVLVGLFIFGITAVEPIGLGLVVSLVLMVGITLFQTRKATG